MLVSLISAVVRALPEGFVLLLGLGAAAWLYRRARSAGIALGVGIVLIALELLLGIVTRPLLHLGTEQGWLSGDSFPVVSSVTRALLSALGGLGIIALLASACLGPAPDRNLSDDEVF